MELVCNILDTRTTSFPEHNDFLCSDNDKSLTMLQLAILTVDYPATLLCNHFVIHVKTKERQRRSAKINTVPSRK